MDVDKDLLRRAAKAAGGLDWEWWTSNSYRRLTFKAVRDARDGGALHATTHPFDKWPDVSMAPGVQDFIGHASPKAVLALLDRIEELEAALRPFARAHKEWDGVGCSSDMTIGYIGQEAGEDVLLTFGDLGRAAEALKRGPDQPVETPTAPSGSSCLVHGEVVAGGGAGVPGEQG